PDECLVRGPRRGRRRRRPPRVRPRRLRPRAAGPRDGGGAAPRGVRGHDKDRLVDHLPRDPAREGARGGTMVECPVSSNPGGFLKRLAIIALIGFAACGGGSDPGTLPDNTGGITTLQVEDLVVGTGAAAATGDTLNVNYVGTLLNGQVFDCGAYTFRLGAGSVIPGWDQGLVGMKVGGRRQLTIPPALAYGASGNGPIPPTSPVPSP